MDIRKTGIRYDHPILRRTGFIKASVQRLPALYEYLSGESDHAEIRSDYSYIYFSEIKALGGYPSGIQGKGLLMLSGGIDSPVAGFLAMKRGISIDCIYYESPPHTSLEAKNKVITVTTIKTDKYAVLICSFIGKITFNNSVFAL